MNDEDYPLYQRPPQVVELEIWSFNGYDVCVRGDGIDMEIPFDDIQAQLDIDWQLGDHVKVRLV